MEKINEKHLKVSGQTQQVSVELYKVISKHQKLDQFMKEMLLHMVSQMYSSANDLLESENNMELLCRLKLIHSEITHVNNLMLMCFQLGMFSSDLCIDYGQKLEFVKVDLKKLVDVQDKLVKKDFKIDLNEDDIDWEDL